MLGVYGCGKARPGGQALVGQAPGANPVAGQALVGQAPAGRPRSGKPSGQALVGQALVRALFPPFRGVWAVPELSSGSLFVLYSGRSWGLFGDDGLLPFSPPEFLSTSPRPLPSFRLGCGLGCVYLGWWLWAPL